MEYFEVITNAKTGEVTKRPYTEAEVAAAKAAQHEAVRVQRDALLTASDWTQVADAPVDTAAWATYRQDLRDIPAQSGFPDNITWPQEPTT